MAKALTLATKYRPQGWDALVEQEDVKIVIQNQLKTGNLKHAYLFCGSRGTGKTTCAKILSAAVNCEDPQNGDPCGKCPSLRFQGL